MIGQALKADAPFKSALRNERVSSFRLNLKIHATNMLYDMRSECTIDGEVNMARWQQIVGSVREWDPATISKQTAIPCPRFSGISEQYRFSESSTFGASWGRFPVPSRTLTLFTVSTCGSSLSTPRFAPSSSSRGCTPATGTRCSLRPSADLSRTVLDSTKREFSVGPVAGGAAAPTTERRQIRRFPKISSGECGRFQSSLSRTHPSLRLCELPVERDAGFPPQSTERRSDPQGNRGSRGGEDGQRRSEGAFLAWRPPERRPASRTSEAPKSRVASVRGGSVVSAKSRPDPSLQPAVREDRPTISLGSERGSRSGERGPDLLALRRFREPAHDLPLRYRTDERREDINSRFAFQEDVRSHRRGGE